MFVNINDVVEHFKGDTTGSIEIRLKDKSVARWWNLWRKKGYHVHEEYSYSGLKDPIFYRKREIVTSDNYMDELIAFCIDAVSNWREYIDEGSKLIITNCFKGEHKDKFKDILETYFSRKYSGAIPLKTLEKITVNSSPQG